MYCNNKRNHMFGERIINQHFSYINIYIYMRICTYTTMFYLDFPQIIIKIIIIIIRRCELSAMRIENARDINKEKYC